MGPVACNNTQHDTNISPWHKPPNFVSSRQKATITLILRLSETLGFSKLHEHRASSVGHRLSRDQGYLVCLLCACLVCRLHGPHLPRPPPPASYPTFGIERAMDQILSPATASLENRLLARALLYICCDDFPSRQSDS